GDYDLAGFAVGAVERGRQITGAGIAAGDVVLGLASSGVHSNGFSLVRKIVTGAGARLEDPAPFAGNNRTLAQVLLEPTRLYVTGVLGAIKQGAAIKGLAHITGGGLSENIPRVLPQGLGVRLDASAWPMPPVFKWMAQEGALSEADLARTFNCGIGMVVIVSPGEAKQVADALSAGGESVHTIGQVVQCANDARVIIDNAGQNWMGGS
ncbi:MAG: phosphoribosylformylglycinamidine cyclo-ligase, partial [Alphaproteobacteria bacterium]|nr:phosphoribosylformylglycinamidine cyclo-ligase [Alphaproteobacteria bacterium]